MRSSIDVLNFQRLYDTLDVGEGGDAKPLKDALDSALRRAASAAVASGAKASFSLTINIKPQRRGQMSLSAGLKTTLPEPPMMPIAVYAGPNNTLLASDPDQPAIEGTRPRPIKAVDGGEES